MLFISDKWNDFMLTLYSLLRSKGAFLSCMDKTFTALLKKWSEKVAVNTCKNMLTSKDEDNFDLSIAVK